MLADRIEDLRRRVEQDPASIAFAQLGEEYRRAGQLQESVDVCRAGLDRHPGYLSARVTLGRALLELGHLDDAQHELGVVLKSAPENLAAVRGMAEIHHRRGSLGDALAHYETALALARNDPDLQETVADLQQRIAPKPAAAADGLSFEQMHQELQAQLPELPALLAPAPALEATPDPVAPAESEVLALPADPPSAADPELAAERERAHHAVAALEEWLAAVHVTRADPQP